MVNLVEPTPHAGWGRTIFSRPRRIASSSDDFNSDSDGRGAIATGNLRSYGDSALNSNGVSISTKFLKSITFLENANLVCCGSGVTLGELERAAIAKHKYPFVVPGTEYVTIGGAIAADIHGKSHHKVGSFCDHVARIRILLANGDERDLFPEGSTRDWFRATCAGLGLTGTILEADIKLKSIESSYISTKNLRFQSLAELSDLLQTQDKLFQYSVAWIDISGDYSGRGILTLGNHSKRTELTGFTGRSLFKASEPRKIRLFFSRGFNIITPFTVRLFNSVWFNKPSFRKNVDVRKFMHPLDSVGNWNYLYGKPGFLQYQFVIPDNKFEFLDELLIMLRENRIASPMSVLKKLGPNSLGFLGFTQPGWSLAIDVPRNTPNLSDFLEYLDRRIIEMGGKVYLVKDSRLSQRVFRSMYEQFSEWKRIKMEMDPLGFWVSDQSRRLDL
ncbi:decaprenylphospho-beta-D-ribofuranose 2-oxidase [Candidatus Planktophila lacus]|uniref:FAD-binding oxidoreductase n=1 Tax=Candidatus Planktophila lacus TaxID=1884913 RepID=UPI000BAC8AE2|nr:FAD-binding oxidoreductase [Candidatus Planktophila lacus]ASY24506.1 decaprenylphospho-beta-D-ribofuranose 2-oxidase [Candidatus Planktophila lacus]